MQILERAEPVGINCAPKRHTKRLDSLAQVLQNACDKLREENLNETVEVLKLTADKFEKPNSDPAYRIHRLRTIYFAAYVSILQRNRPSLELSSIVEMMDEIGFKHPVHWIDMRSEVVAKLREEGKRDEAELFKQEFLKLANETIEQLQLAARAFGKE